ncbi:hypothetical protein [Maliponia aquimaris]|uniref:hypothetical protein n=1 Tax=Maliponia aquimaris TaxID=1673631 RepID=UPI000B8B0C46|nr:hypothetical protein [Maliponia aquimaris]
MILAIGAGADNLDAVSDLHGCERIIAEMPYLRIRAARHLPHDLRDRLTLHPAQDLAESA